MQVSTENEDSTDSSKSIQTKLFNPNTFHFDHKTSPLVSKNKNHLATQIVKQDGNSQNNFLQLIPDEIALSILQYLELSDLRSLLLVNKKWQELAEDITLWKRLFNTFTQGYLWQYLFKNPDISAYDTYFQEVFKFNVASYKNLEEIFTRVAKHFTKENDDFEKRKSIRKDYFKGLDILSIKNQLEAITQILQNFSKDEREIYLIAFETKADLSFKEYSKILVLLHRISLFDTLLTDISYMNVFCASRKWNMHWFYDEKANVMLSSHAIVAICAYSNNNKILKTIFEKPAFSHLHNRFTRTELLLCADLEETLIGEIILKDSSVLNFLTDDDLITLMRLPFGNGVRSFFPSFMEDNSALVSRMHGSLLTKLVNWVETYSSFILKDQNLLKLLSDEEIILIAQKCLPVYFAEVINSETFFSFLEKKPTSFLMQLPLEEIIKNDRTVKRLDSEEVLKITDYESISVGEAVAQQNILLQQFSNNQLLLLALRHPDIAIVMLKNKKLFDRWTYSQLDGIIEDNEGSQWDEEIRLLVQQRKDYFLQEEENQSSFQSEYSDTYIRSIEQSEATSLQSNSRNSSSISSASVIVINRSDKYSFSPWKILGGVALTLLTIIGIALIATGVGAVAGAPIAVGALAAINILNVSVQALAVGSLVVGAVTALTASTLLYCGNAIKNRFKSNLESRLEDDSPCSSTYSSIMKRSLATSSTLSEKKLGEYRIDHTPHYDSVFTKIESRAISSKLGQEDINYRPSKRWLS